MRTCPSELSTLSRELYKENMKTEARQISQLAKELNFAEPTTRAQDAFDKSVEKDMQR